MAVVRVSRKEQWGDLVREARASGLPPEQWCKENGVSPQSLETWSRWFDGTDSGMEEAPGQVETKGRIIERAVLPSGELIELESKRSTAQEGPTGKAGEGQSGPPEGKAGGQSRPRVRRKGAAGATPKTVEEPVSFVEMPQFAAWCASQSHSDADHSRKDFEPRVMIRAGEYELYIGDGFSEQTLAAVLRVIAHA